eukprot:4388226-Alexandrium_andersonii.AAC.2
MVSCRAGVGLPRRVQLGQDHDAKARCEAFAKAGGGKKTADMGKIRQLRKRILARTESAARADLNSPGPCLAASAPKSAAGQRRSAAAAGSPGRLGAATGEHRGRGHARGRRPPRRARQASCGAQHGQPQASGRRREEGARGAGGELAQAHRRVPLLGGAGG